MRSGYEKSSFRRLVCLLLLPLFGLVTWACEAGEAPPAAERSPEQFDWDFDWDEDAEMADWMGWFEGIPVPDGRRAGAYYQEIGLQFLQEGQRDSALAYFGSALVQEDPIVEYEMAWLLEVSPNVGAAPHVIPVDVFQDHVTDLMAATPIRGDVEITSPLEAQEVLEALLSHRRVRIEFIHPPGRLFVNFKRYIYRDRDDVLWETVRSDTVLWRRSSAYVFQYRLPDMEADTTVDISCANGCRVPIW